jgi:predicted Zn-dependent protease
MKIFKFTLAITALAAGCIFMAPLARGHEGPEADIEELTERMKFEGVSAHLLLQRAIEYNVLGKSAEAIKDLERAAELESHSPTIQRELSRTYFAAGKTNEALDTAARGIKYA